MRNLADVARAAGVAPSTVSLVSTAAAVMSRSHSASVSSRPHANSTGPHAAARRCAAANPRAELTTLRAFAGSHDRDDRHPAPRLPPPPLPYWRDGARDAEVIRSVLGDTQLAGIIRETTLAEASPPRLLANLGIPVVAITMIEADPIRLRVPHPTKAASTSHHLLPALVDPNTGIGSGQATSRRSHQPRSPTPHRTCLRHQLHLLFPARLGTRHRLPGRPSPPDREPGIFHRARRRLRHPASSRSPPTRPVSPHRPVHWIR